MKVDTGTDSSSRYTTLYCKMKNKWTLYSGTEACLQKISGKEGLYELIYFQMLTLIDVYIVHDKWTHVVMQLG